MKLKRNLTITSNSSDLLGFGDSRMELNLEEKDILSCCGSTRFAKEMALISPFSSLQDAQSAARHIWFNKVDVNGWLEAFSVNAQIGETDFSAHVSQTTAQWSKQEQSTALATATGSALQELSEWNGRYRQKFGFIFLICATGKSTEEILAELKKRYPNRLLVELEIAAHENMKITELRLAKLFSARANNSSTTGKYPSIVAKNAEEDDSSIISVNMTTSEGSNGKPVQVPTGTRPPITTHVLDVSQGSPAAGVEVLLEMWKGTQPRPAFGGTDSGGWVFQGSSATDLDGRSGQLLSTADVVNPGIYRISFNTGKYNPDGFFPYVSVVFEIREPQNREHFHVPLLLSPFSFSTYRGS